MQLDIIIINYNSGKHLKNCLESVVKSNGAIDNSRIIVYDNGSIDNSLISARKFFSNIQYIGNHTNLGFAGAINIESITGSETHICDFLRVNKKGAT